MEVAGISQWVVEVVVEEGVVDLAVEVPGLVVQEGVVDEDGEHDQPHSLPSCGLDYWIIKFCVSAVSMKSHQLQLSSG